MRKGNAKRAKVNQSEKKCDKGMRSKNRRIMRKEEGIEYRKEVNGSAKEKTI